MSRHTKLVYSDSTHDQLDEVVIPDKVHIKEYEERYGYPTDLDKVWEDRVRQYGQS